MSSLMKALGIDRLSIDDRVQLLEEISESIAAASEEITLSEAHKEDLRRRLDAYRDNPKAGSPWEEVKARLEGRPGEAPAGRQSRG
ncbi:MAG TPA: addiction module protein [Isosphaeraceae bacterium]